MSDADTTSRSERSPAAGGPIVVLAGNIGVGKTTLGRLLRAGLGGELFEESVVDNPYLARFYADMPRWALHLNMYFLAHRAQQVLDAAGSERVAVMDRSFYEDRVFVEVAKRLGQTSDETYALFDRMEAVLARTLPPPTLLIFLTAGTDVLFERIRHRGRPFEQNITADYLTSLGNQYATWIAGYDRSPVLRVDTSQTDLASANSPKVAALLAEVRAIIALDAR